MNEIIINNMPVLVKEYDSQRVVTLKDIDTVHGRPEGTAKRNFKANRKHFIEGEDYFIVKSGDIQKDEFRTFEIPNRGLTLITETGYLMLVKSFTDELAWKVQRELIINYFRTQQTAQSIESIISITVAQTVKALMPLIRQTSTDAKPLRRIRKKHHHATPSKISTLPPELKMQVDNMLASGEYSCQQVANFIMNNSDISISQMAVNRYKHNNFVDEYDQLTLL